MSRSLFADGAWADYCFWQTQDKKTLKRINALIDEKNRPIYRIIGAVLWQQAHLYGHWVVVAVLELQVNRCYGD
jgi:toxin YoeB